jgi:hypothetical protein
MSSIDLRHVSIDFVDFQYCHRLDATRAKFDRLDRLPVRKNLYKGYHTNTLFGESERLIALFIIINANEINIKLKCDEAEQLNSVT